MGQLVVAWGRGLRSEAVREAGVAWEGSLEWGALAQMAEAEKPHTQPPQQEPAGGLWVEVASPAAVQRGWEGAG